MSTRITPRLGQTVLYTLSETDERQIREDRMRAGTSTFHGNDAREGDTYPAIIVREFVLEREWLERQLRGGILLAAVVAGAEEKATKVVASVAGLPSGMAPKGGRLSASEIEGRIAEEYQRQIDTAPVNLKVLLDGNDVYWATSRTAFDPKVHGAWSMGHMEADLAGIELSTDNPDHWKSEPRGHWTDVPASW